MKYLYNLLIMLLLTGCQLAPEDEDEHGFNTVYSGGTYQEAAEIGGLNADRNEIMLGSYAPGPAYGYNPATNSDHYDNPEYGKDVVGGPKASAKDRIIYFAYDSSQIDARAKAIVNQHATYLKNRPSIRILLEGHTDSRGSREYNIALGERRAISVSKQFKALGVNPRQIRVISYGEENPAVRGYNADAYKRNRRVVIQY